MTTKPNLSRQLGGHHWRNGIIEHLEKGIPRTRTIVCAMDTGWIYLIEDTPNRENSIQLKVFCIDYQHYNINFDSDDFEANLNNLLDNPNNNIISVVNVQTNT